MRPPYPSDAEWALLAPLPPRPRRPAVPGAPSRPRVGGGLLRRRKEDRGDRRYGLAGVGGGPIVAAVVPPSGLQDLTSVRLDAARPRRLPPAPPMPHRTSPSRALAALAALAAALVTAPLAARPAVAQTTIASMTNGPFPSSGNYYWGTPVAVTAAGSYNQLTFSFLLGYPLTTPNAEGTAFLLTQAYIGTPDELSTATPGFLAASTNIVGGRYVFAPGVAVIGGQTYYVYENRALEVYGGGTGGSSAVSYGGSDAFRGGGPEINYQMQGVAVTAAPEPATWALLGAGLLAMGGVARRRRRA